MRRTLGWLALGLVAVCPIALHADGTAKSPFPSTCETHGTSVHFFKTPSEAAKQALKDEKLVLVLHISGIFEDTSLTWNNAEALRVNALANPQVGKFVDENFCAAFQKVGTFRIVGRNKQGGNVASYFCAPDGRVLHVIAGPVNAATFLREAQWVVATTKKAIETSKGDGGKFKVAMRKAHVDRLRAEHGLVTEAVTFDPPEAQSDNDALTYRDPTGRPLAPKLPPPPIDGPDVKLRAQVELSAVKSAQAVPTANGLGLVRDRGGRGWALGNQGRVHLLMAAHSMTKIETVYGSVFEGILGERVSTRPVEIVNPFPWHNRKVKLGGK